MDSNFQYAGAVNLVCCRRCRGLFRTTPASPEAGKGSHPIGRRREMDSNHRFLGRQQGLRAVAWVGAAVTRAAKLAARLPFGLHPPLVLGDPHLSVGCGGEWADRGWVVPRGNDLDGECSVSRDHPIGRFCVQVDRFRHLVRRCGENRKGPTPAPGSLVAPAILRGAGDRMLSSPIITTRRY